MKYLLVSRVNKAQGKKGEEVALRLLARRDYSREELRQKLTKKGFALAEIEEVLAKLSAAQLLNDGQYAQRLASYYGREKFWGPGRIKQKLREKGIAEELAQEVIAQEEKNFPAVEKLRALLKKKLKKRTLGELAPKEIRKLNHYLYRHGFDWEEIMDILKKEGGLTEE